MRCITSARPGRVQEACTNIEDSASRLHHRDPAHAEGQRQRQRFTCLRYWSRQTYTALVDLRISREMCVPAGSSRRDEKEEPISKTYLPRMSSGERRLPWSLRHSAWPIPHAPSVRCALPNFRLVQSRRMLPPPRLYSLPVVVVGSFVLSFRRLYRTPVGGCPWVCCCSRQCVTCLGSRV